MPRIAEFKCAGTIFDIYDSERVPVGVSSNKYYITPNRTVLAHQWLWENGLDKIRTPEHVQALVSKNILGVY